MAVGEIQLDFLLRVTELLGFLGGGLLVSFKIGKALSRMETIMGVQTVEIKELKEAQEKTNAVLTQVAVQNNRLDRLEADIFMLRRGEGMILPLSRAAKQIPEGQ